MEKRHWWRRRGCRGKVPPMETAEAWANHPTWPYLSIGFIKRSGILILGFWFIRMLKKHTKSQCHPRMPGGYNWAIKPSGLPRPTFFVPPHLLQTLWRALGAALGCRVLREKELRRWGGQDCPHSAMTDAFFFLKLVAKSQKICTICSKLDEIDIQIGSTWSFVRR